KTTKAEAAKDGIKIFFDGKDSKTYDLVLVSVGRVPNGKRIGADRAGIQVDERGFISVDSQMSTNVSHIFAIGDIARHPMLAHQAVHGGTGAGDLSSEIAHAVEMGSDATDLGKTIHPHPTLSESVGMAAELFEGVCTDLPPQRKK